MEVASSGGPQAAGCKLRAGSTDLAPSQSPDRGSEGGAVSAESFGDDFAAPLATAGAPRRAAHALSARKTLWLSEEGALQATARARRRFGASHASVLVLSLLDRLALRAVSTHGPRPVEVVPSGGPCRALGRFGHSAAAPPTGVAAPCHCPADSTSAGGLLASSSRVGHAMHGSRVS
mmetsp:Transcript_29616/g.94856  ORF Transcript_29616/g.94856 Transcript_29616/m.94856 type:complete len:177 (-) Transcript_29616:981-1511(-)